MRLLRRGKVKEVYEVDDSTLEFHFTDNISVFDKIIPTAIPQKGEVLCRVSAHWFELVKEAGFRTHFLGLRGPNRMRVKRVRIPQEEKHFEGGNYLIPVEWISRYYVAGSLFRRLKNGEIRGEQLGFSDNYSPQYGDRLPHPLMERTTKFEDYDRKISLKDALELGHITLEEYKQIEMMTLRVDEMMEKEIRKRGLTHVDGKKEFAFDGGRKLMLVDTFGTPDEDRFWDLGELKKGRLVELSKEYVRRYYESTGYRNRLQRAREKGEAEPEIDPLPTDLVHEVHSLYVNLYERLTGKEF